MRNGPDRFGDTGQRYFFWNNVTHESRWGTADFHAGHIQMGICGDEANPGWMGYVYLAAHEDLDILWHRDTAHKLSNKERMVFERVPSQWSAFVKTLAVMRYDRGEFKTTRGRAKILTSLRRFAKFGGKEHPIFKQMLPRLARDYGIHASQVRHEIDHIFGKMQQVYSGAFAAKKDPDVHAWWSHHDGVDSLDEKWHAMLVGAMWFLEEQGWDAIEYMMYIQQRAAKPEDRGRMRHLRYRHASET